MAILPITKEEFDSFSPKRKEELIGLFAKERAWFRNSDRKLIGSILFDFTDKDWNYVVLGQEIDADLDGFRWIAGQASFSTRVKAKNALVAEMQELEDREKATEELYIPNKAVTNEDQRLIFTDVNKEVRNYLARHPEKLYELDPRKFEELIASILKDFGCDVNLTKETRDGGRDIIATTRTAVCKIVMFVECKRWAKKKKVGIEIVDRLVGVHHAFRANKSLIITTSSFTKDAVKRARMSKHEIELKDFEDIRGWLKELDDTDS